MRTGLSTLRSDLTAAYVTMADGSYEDSNSAWSAVIAIEGILEDEGRLDLIAAAHSRAEAIVEEAA